MGIRVAGGSKEGLGSSRMGAASVGADEVVDDGVCIGGGRGLAIGAGPGSLLPAAAAASALASFSALVGRPRFLFGGGSVGDGWAYRLGPLCIGFGRISRPPAPAPGAGYCDSNGNGLLMFCDAACADIGVGVSGAIGAAIGCIDRDVCKSW